MTADPAPQPTDATTAAAVPDRTALTAARLAELLAGELPAGEDVSPAALRLAAELRELVTAAVLTDVDDAERSAVADAVAALTRRLSAARRAETVHLVRHADGWIEHLTQAGSGRLNPQAPVVEFLDAEGRAVPTPVLVDGELRARCTLTAAHGGPPGRAHGGVVMVLLDQIVGLASSLAGRSGMTGTLTVRLRAATPYDVPLLIVARSTGSSGRRHQATGEILVDGACVAEASGIFVGRAGS